MKKYYSNIKLTIVSSPSLKKNLTMQVLFQNAKALTPLNTSAIMKMIIHNRIAFFNDSELCMALF